MGFSRKKTALEMNETLQEQCERLRGALFFASQARDLKEARRIMRAAMRGKLHGKELQPFKVPVFSLYL